MSQDRRAPTICARCRASFAPSRALDTLSLTWILKTKIGFTREHPLNCNSNSQPSHKQTFQHRVEYTVIEADTHINETQIEFILKSLRRFLYSPVTLNHWNYLSLCVARIRERVKSGTSLYPCQIDHSEWFRSLCQTDIYKGQIGKEYSSGRFSVRPGIFTFLPVPYEQTRIWLS